MRKLLLLVALAAQAQNRAPEQDVAAFLKVHNDARAAVGAPPLAWSPKLAAHAQQWADEIARSGKFQHRPNNPYGENLAGSTASAEPQFAARLWLDEKKDYHGDKIEAATFMKVGHYTQMIWSRTTHVGYGIARGRDGMWIVVANYEPAGNVIGQRP